MEFFIPGAKDDAAAERVYTATKDFAKTTTGWSSSDRRIYKIEHIHDGTHYTAEVGQQQSRLRETVIAIIETAPDKGQPYLVCTPNRGVLRGEPMLVGDSEILDIDDFEA